jgi:hypothetical protein
MTRTNLRLPGEKPSSGPRQRETNKADQERLRPGTVLVDDSGDARWVEPTLVRRGQALNVSPEKDGPATPSDPAAASSDARPRPSLAPSQSLQPLQSHRDRWGAARDFLENWDFFKPMSVGVYGEIRVNSAAGAFKKLQT